MTARDVFTFLRSFGIFFGCVGVSVAISAAIGLLAFVFALMCLLPFATGILLLQERHGRWPYKPAKH